MQITHGRSFVMSDKSVSLMVALFSREPRANCSHLLTNISDFEQKSEERKSEFPTLAKNKYCVGRTSDRETMIITVVWL